MLLKFGLFEASNGFADAPPTAIDTDGDGQHDRVCWVTWSEENILTRAWSCGLSRPRYKSKSGFG